MERSEMLVKRFKLNPKGHLNTQAEFPGGHMKRS